MEYGLEPVKREPTLFNVLGEWNHTEGLFRKHFGEESLGDRDFKKMKLNEYDRMWYQFNGKIHTKDERAMMRMLRFQRRKLRRSLYPGLLGRLWNRTSNFIAILSDARSIPLPTVSRQDDAHRYAGYTLDTPGPRQSQGQTPDGKNQRERYRPKYRHGRDLGPRKHPGDGRKHRHSI